METLYISDTTDSFFLARWLFLKKKISQAEMYELAQRPREEIIQKMNDLDFVVKYRNKKEKIYEPEGSSLLNDELLD